MCCNNPTQICAFHRQNLEDFIFEKVNKFRVAHGAKSLQWLKSLHYLAKREIELITDTHEVDVSRCIQLEDHNVTIVNGILKKSSTKSNSELLKNWVSDKERTSILISEMDFTAVSIGEIKNHLVLSQVMAKRKNKKRKSRASSSLKDYGALDTINYECMTETSEDDNISATKRRRFQPCSDILSDRITTNVVTESVSEELIEIWSRVRRELNLQELVWDFNLARIAKHYCLDVVENNADLEGSKFSPVILNLECGEDEIQCAKLAFNQLCKNGIAYLPLSTINHIGISCVKSQQGFVFVLLFNGRSFNDKY